VKGGGRPAPAARRSGAARGLTYKDAGGDIDAKMRAIQRLRLIARGTFRKGVLTDIGSFGGLFDLTAAGPLRHPVLVSSTDGVGSKLKIAFQTGQHKTVGMDLVNHCINDILVQGAIPLFFLDYIAMGKLDADVMIDVVAGLARATYAAGRVDTARSWVEWFDEQGLIDRMAMERYDWPQAATLAEQALAIVRAGQLDDYINSALVSAVAARTALHRGDVQRAHERLAGPLACGPCSPTRFPGWPSRRCSSSPVPTWRSTTWPGPGWSCGRPTTSCGGDPTLAPCHSRPPS